MMASLSESSRSRRQVETKGAENKVTVLYKSFSNNLLLGQWELAQACLGQLSKECQQFGLDVKDTLRKVAEYPYNVSLGSKAVRNPHELSWLCLLEYRGLQDSSEQQHESFEYLTKEIEFRLLISQTCQNVDQNVIKELYQCFKYNHAIYRGPHRLSPLSKATTAHIQQVLQTTPVLGYSVISYLSVNKESQQKQNSGHGEKLQAIFITCINKHLDDLSKCSQTDRASREKICEHVYTLLSLYDPTPLWNYSQLQQLFTRLLQLSRQRESCVKKESVLSVLIGRSTPYLVESFCKLDHELSLPSKLKHDGIGGLSDREKEILHLFHDVESEECWRNLFLFSTDRQKHFLQLVLDSALSFIRNEKFDELNDLLHPLELQPLKPIVLLLGWSQCKTSSIARRLLDVLWDEKTPCRHPALAAGCRKLAYQIDLIQWCLDRTKPLLESSGIGVTNQERATHLLQGLEAHSVLFVLHQSTTLASLDQGEVLELLQNTARRQDTDSEIKKKSVRFRLSGEDQNNVSEFTGDGSKDISIEQQRDLSIYRSFCAIRNIMDAIAFCADNADLELMNPICVKKAPRPRSLSKSFMCESAVSSSEGEDSSCQDSQTESQSASLMYDRGSFQSLYEQFVTQKLADTRNHLKVLHPLTYRVEVLEDIFSLLFTTHRDVQECSNTTDFDSDEGAEEGSKRNSQENMSLNTSMVSEDDTSPLVTMTEKFQSGAPPFASQSVPVTSGYDEPFQEQTVTRSLHQNVSIPLNKLAEEVNKSAAALLTSEQIQRKRTSSGTRSRVNQALDRSAIFKLGFLANEYLVRDLLAMLKDCLLDINPVKLKLSGQKTDHSKTSETESTISPSMEESLTQLVKSSITSDTLQKRLTRLTQYIHEAQWRFQLVSHDQLPKQAGHVLHEPVFIPGDDNFDAYRSDSWRNGRSRSPSRLSVSNGDGEIQGSQSENYDPDLRRRRSSGSSTRPVRSTQGKLIKASLEIIPLMLSTPDTLLTMSLAKGNFAQAAQVIKLFKLEASEAASEVSFSESFHKSALKLSTLESSGRERTSASVGKPSLKALGSVAAAGIASASLMNVTEDLLASKVIAKLPTPKVTKGVNMPSNVMTFFTELDVSTAILLDLLCTSCKTWDMCNKMLDVIKTKVTLESETKQPIGWRDPTPPSSSTMKSKTDVRLKGALLFLTQAEKLVHSFIDEEGTLKLSTVSARLPSKLSFEQHLRTATCSLKADKANEACRVIEEIRQIIDKIKQAFEQNHESEKNKVFESSPAISPVGSPQASPKDSSPKVKDTPKPPGIHAVYKQFTTALDKHVPKGGLVHLLKRQGADPSHNKNYLLSLYEHVRELAILVAECESRHKDKMVIPQNYFHTLQESPVSILGRLIFVKKMMPCRLETVAEKLSLNLTHIIVHSCCPRIPSKHLPPLQALQLNQDYEKYGPKIIYNSGPATSASPDPSHPEELIRSLLSQMLALMKDTATKSNAQSIFDTSSAKLAFKLPEYRTTLGATSQLQGVDLRLLETREQALCFYGNLQNLMIIHLYLHHIWQRLLNQAEQDSSKEASESQQGDFVLSSTIDSVVHLNQFTYRVGQLGVVSLFDLKYTICRIGLHPPVNWKGLIPLRNLSERDDWLHYAPPLEARLMVVLSDGCLSSPPLQVLRPDTVDSQLEAAMTEYLNHTVEVDTDAQKVTIPALLSWYQQDFSQSSGEQYEASLQGLLNVIATSIGGSKGEQILQMVDQENAAKGNSTSDGQAFLLTVSDFVFEFAFTFEMSSIPGDPGHLSPQGSVSPPGGMDSSIDSLLDRSDRSFMVETPSYQLTPVTLDYVKMDSVLVATMVSLVCADELDDIEYQIQDDHFESSSVKSRTTSMSDISLVDIRSYRYQRLTDDYPILQRHLLNFIIPLAGADNPEIMNSNDQILKFVTNDIDDNVKTCMFSLHDSIQFQQVVLDIINRLLLSHKWSAILVILKSITETTMKKRPDWQVLYDFVLGCWAEQESDLNPDISDVLNNLRKFCCPDTQARTVLSICRSLPVDCGIDLLESCLVDELNENLRKTVEDKLQELRVYLQITDSVKNLQFKLSKQTSDLVRLEDMESARRYHSALEKFTDWRKVVATSVSQPMEVLEILLKTKDFDMIKSWSRLHSLSHKLKMEVEEQHLISLLTSEKPDTAKAFQILEEVRTTDPSGCMSLCEGLLKKLSSQRDSSRHWDIQFLSSFLLNQLQAELTDSQAETLRLQHIGAKALLCLPTSLRGDYSHLISTPHLILEQLLMNMKSDLAGKVFQKIKNDYLLVKTGSHRYSTDNFNQLLEKYATKAVEVMVVQTLETDKERSCSAGSGSSGKTDDTDPSLTAGQKLLGESMLVRRRGMDGAVSPKPALRQRSLSSSPSMVAPRQPPKFVMPPQPPSKDQWVPDSSASTCMVCKVERFSMFNRRHHCRRCGRVVCAACSSKRTVIDGESSRTCDDCYEQRYRNSESKGQADQEFYTQRMQERLSGTRGGSVYGGSPTSVLSPDGSRLIDQVPISDNWMLRNDEKYNEELREEFYYEQAPSVSLCISVLSHHSSRRECGQQMLTMCDHLSEFLQPVAPGVPNPEVDYSLIISMMRQLLFQAKLRFLQCGENQGVGLCDMYQTRVDLLKILVAANYKDLPSIKELTKVDTVRRLRDKLIEDERLPLAMEVSTKCGLDTSGVWSAWGKSCLYIGDYTAAREKFSHCLKVPSDKNLATSSRLMQDIIDYLESIPITGATEIQTLLQSPASIKTLINLPSASHSEEGSLETAQYQECLFYLRTYGTYLENLGFLRRNGYWMKAAQYVINHRCCSEVFVEGLLSPAMVSGELGKLLDQMLMLDAGLEKWNLYLTAACKHLLKHRLYNALYQVQIFMKDYIRAAMTCITHFYQRGAQSYLDLATRLQFLFEAQQNLQSYLDPAQWMSVRHPAGARRGPNWNQQNAESAVRLVLPQEEVTKHIRTIALQIEVTKFLEQCLTHQEGNSTALAASYVGASQSTGLPVLFNNKVRADLVGMILLSGNDITVSFDLALRIITECRLNPTTIFTHTAREMAKHQHYAMIRRLLECVEKCGLGGDDTLDEIIRAALLVITDKETEAKEVDVLIKMLRKDSNKINAYILCGKLRSAYLLAVKGERVEDVQRIAGAAQRMNQSAVRNICNKWLQQRK